MAVSGAGRELEASEDIICCKAAENHLRIS